MSKLAGPSSSLRGAQVNPKFPAAVPLISHCLQVKSSNTGVMGWRAQPVEHPQCNGDTIPLIIDIIDCPDFISLKILTFCRLSY